MLFAISFAQIEKDKKITGKNKLFFRNGFAEHSKANDLVSGKNSWAEGGAAAIKADYFKQLGGFRDIYAPFYWEDIDLSYRAYKSNWHVMFVADYVVEHHHESTIGTYFSNMFVKKIAYRNQLFFIWTNIQDGSLLFNHVCALPIQVVRTILKGDFAFISALASAFFSMPEVLNTRSINKKNAHMTDRSVFATL
jgi:GT2 family glycosyltransferase